MQPLFSYEYEYVEYLIFYDGNALAVLRWKYMIEESCLAGTQKTSDDSGRNPVINWWAPVSVMEMERVSEESRIGGGMLELVVKKGFSSWN